ncbi:lipase family protein [Acinetobacter indicus]|uniref:alpha/beta hydrolase n=1 Tax=Acinetobacter TaxID=469 RepID=UPI0015D2A87D|nr:MULTISPECIES: alpha/beta fold hydrolase [Acinetobacter]UNW08747.1 lipase family protein [Acinetobacter indicus]
MRKIWLSVALASSSLFLTACNDDNDNSAVIIDDGIPKHNISQPVVKAELYLDQDSNANMVLQSVSASQTLMTYKMLGVNGQETQATALLFEPNQPKPAGGWPIVVWAHGTTGVADICAPSRQGLKGNEYFIERLLAEGYAVVAPDYEGLGEPSGQELHPFLNLKSQAYSITDAVVAAHQHFNNSTETRWTVVGHSQGGQAALGAAQYASRAQLNYKGAVAIAPASSLSMILSGGEQQAAAEPDLSKKIQILAPLDTFTALITAGLRNSHPTLQYSEVFKNPTDLLAAEAESLCNADLGAAFGGEMVKYAQTYGNLAAYPRTQTDFMTTVPEIKDFLTQESQPLTVKISTPVFIYQGSADPTIPKQVTDFLVQSARQQGTRIHYVTDQDLPIDQKWDHGSVYVDNWDEIVADVKSIMPTQ